MNKRAAAQFRETLPQAIHAECSTPDKEVCPDVDFVITRKGPRVGLAVTPVTDAGKKLLKSLFKYSEDYRGASVILKHCDLPSLRHHIFNAGLTLIQQ